jgi:hypothetical protein
LGTKYKVTVEVRVDDYADSEWKAVDLVHKCLRGALSNYEILEVKKET